MRCDQLPRNLKICGVTPDIPIQRPNDGDRHQRSFDAQWLQRLQCLLNPSFNGDGRVDNLRKTGYARRELAIPTCCCLSAGLLKAEPVARLLVVVILALVA
jgi:hypothetical protein